MAVVVFRGEGREQSRSWNTLFTRIAVQMAIIDSDVHVHVFGERHDIAVDNLVS